MIDLHFMRAQQRSVLLDSSLKYLNFACRCKLPEVVVCEIFTYLRNDDLENFIAACSSKENEEYDG